MLRLLVAFGDAKIGAVPIVGRRHAAKGQEGLASLGEPPRAVELLGAREVGAERIDRRRERPRRRLVQHRRRVLGLVAEGILLVDHPPGVNRQGPVASGVRGVAEAEVHWRGIERLTIDEGLQGSNGAGRVAQRLIGVRQKDERRLREVA